MSDDATSRTQTEIEREIADVKERLSQLENHEEKRRTAYEQKCAPLCDELERLMLEHFRLIHGYGLGDKLIVTQEYCDYKAKAHAMSPRQAQDALGLEATVVGADSDGWIQITTSHWGTWVKDIHIIQGMREAWLAKNGGQ